MSCLKHDVCLQCLRENAESMAINFKRKYCITARTEQQIVAMSDSVPPHPDEQPEAWLERLYRAWYYAHS